jgi:hypothetical protein
MFDEDVEEEEAESLSEIFNGLITSYKSNKQWSRVECRVPFAAFTFFLSLCARLQCFCVWTFVGRDFWICCEAFAVLRTLTSFKEFEKL